MITTSDFTTARSKPTEPGFYICLLEKDGVRFFVFGAYTPKDNKFIIENADYSGSALIAWVQIEVAGNVFQQLNNKTIYG